MEEEIYNDKKKDFLEVNQQKLQAVYRDNIRKKAYRKFEELRNKTIENQNFLKHVSDFKKKKLDEIEKKQEFQKIEELADNISEKNKNSMMDSKYIKNKIVADRINNIIKFDPNKKDNKSEKNDFESWYKEDPNEINATEVMKRSRIFQVVKLPEIKNKKKVGTVNDLENISSPDN